MSVDIFKKQCLVCDVHTRIGQVRPWGRPCFSWERKVDVRSATCSRREVRASRGGGTGWLLGALAPQPGVLALWVAWAPVRGWPQDLRESLFLVF